ncbi:MAG TPA: adenylate/guanylate cyclase domain-containing protein [Candidatus Baltobacteraceae bacterium]|nr:adenylate/guanylate cyclase domain-containing protein [Candidatus Baltobacteraceae bacterium]
MATRVEPGTPSSARPSGTVTFLFSDIEGSTERWERDREAMSDALARHDTLMRSSLESRGGYIFKTVGDEFCAAFFTARHCAHNGPVRM